MRKGAIEFDKLVIWALGAVFAIIMLLVVINYFSTGNEGSLLSRVIDKITNPF